MQCTYYYPNVYIYMCICFYYKSFVRDIPVFSFPVTICRQVHLKWQELWKKVGKDWSNLQFLIRHLVLQGCYSSSIAVVFKLLWCSVIFLCKVVTVNANVWKKILPGYYWNNRDFFTLSGLSVKSPKEHIEIDLSTFQIERLSR